MTGTPPAWIGCWRRSAPSGYFWRTHAGAEVDLLLDMRGRLIPIEIKLGHAPRLTRALLQCCTDLAIARGFVLHAGPDSFPLSASVHALSATLLHHPAQLLSTLLGRKRSERARST